MPPKDSKLIIQGEEVNFAKSSDFLSLTDLAKKFSEAPEKAIENWMRNKDTIEFLGLWEMLNNPEFKPPEFEGFRNEAGTNRFLMSPTKWIKATNAKGIRVRSGRFFGGITQEIYDKLHQENQDKITHLENNIKKYSEEDSEYETTLEIVISLATRAKEIFESSEVAEKRMFVRLLLQNPTLEGRKPLFNLQSPFDLVLNLSNSENWLPG